MGLINSFMSLASKFRFAKAAYNKVTSSETAKSYLAKITPDSLKPVVEKAKNGIDKVLDTLHLSKNSPEATASLNQKQESIYGDLENSMDLGHVSKEEQSAYVTRMMDVVSAASQYDDMSSYYGYIAEQMGYSDINQAKSAASYSHKIQEAESAHLADYMKTAREDYFKNHNINGEADAKEYQAYLAQTEAKGNEQIKAAREQLVVDYDQSDTNNNQLSL